MVDKISPLISSPEFDRASHFAYGGGLGLVKRDQSGSSRLTAWIYRVSNNFNIEQTHDTDNARTTSILFNQHSVDYVDSQSMLTMFQSQK